MSISRVSRAGGTAYRIRVELPPDPETGRRRWHSEVIPPGRDAAKRAKVREAELVASLGRDQVQELGGRNVERYMTDDWLPYYSRGRKPGTVKQREQAMRLYVIPRWGAKRLGDIQPMAVQRWYEELLDRGLAANTVRGVHEVLSVSLGQAERWGLIGRNPMRLVRVPSSAPPAMVVWTVEEIARFVDGEDDPVFRTMWAVLAGTGMRVGEVLALRWDDVEWQRRVLRVDETAIKLRGGGLSFGPPKTRSSRREVAVDEAIMRLLRRLKAQQSERRLLFGDGWHAGEFVFDRGDGRPIYPDTTGKRFGKRLAEEGLARATPHDLRHAHITHLAAAGVPLPVIAQRVGHSGVGLLMRVYTHLTGDHQGAAVDAVAGVFAGLRDPDVTKAG